MRVLIVTVKVPFVRGGAEVLADGLLHALRSHGHEADLVEIPFKHYPPERILDHILACRLLDLTQSFGNPIDRRIGLKFPAYLVPHPQKVLWIIHQHRPAYDLWAHPLAGDLMHAPNGRQVRDAIQRADRTFISEAKAVFTLSCNVAKRLKAGCGIDSSPLYSPPADAEAYYCGEAGDYLFFPSRINVLKRQTLVLEALAKTREPLRVRFAGVPDAPQLAADCQRMVSEHGLAGRVEWLGAISDEAKRGQYADALGVVFPPVDEDYGYVTLEAMLSSKPVITCTDSGGPLEFVQDRQTGLAAEPTPESLAACMDELWSSRDQARRWGQAGRDRYAELDISWKTVVSRLLA